MVQPVVLESALTCPYCGVTTTELMPTDECVYFHECVNCYALLGATDPTVWQLLWRSRKLSALRTLEGRRISTLPAPDECTGIARYGAPAQIELRRSALALGTGGLLIC